jgi:putative ABC transport system permease protein
MLALLLDVQYAWRTLRKSPVFAAVAIATLALGIGANTAIFTLVNAVLLRPLPFPEPARLAFVWEETNMFGLRDSVVSLANYADWRAQNHAFQQMGALESGTWRLAGPSEVLQVSGSTVTASLFGTLGVPPAMGRLFREDEDRPGSARVVILSDGLWRRMFGGLPDILGKPILLNDEKYEVVGVMPPGFRFPDSDNDLWTPIGTAYGLGEWSNRGRHNFMVAARLAPGVSLERANLEIRAIAARLQQQYPATNAKVGAFVAPMREHFVADARSPLWVLLAAVGFVLLIGCANIANLLLARATNRKREIAIRIAVGAGRADVLRQLLTESLLLALAGGAFGLLLAFWGTPLLQRLVPSGIAALAAVSVDARVLGFALAISMATGLIFGLAPALQSLQVDLHQTLKQGGRSATRGRQRLEHSLVIVEVALTFVLAIAAGLMIQTFTRLRGTDPGFRTNDILSVRLAYNKRFRAAEQRAAFYDEVLRRVTALPGVVSAGFSNGVPVAFKGWVDGFTIEGQPALAGERITNANYRVVTPDYLRTLGIPLRAGRTLDTHDTADAPQVVLIDEAMRRKFWPNENPLGKRIRFGSGEPWVTVVGVLADIRQAGLDTPPKAELYLSALQQRTFANWLAVRTQGDPAGMAAAVRHAIRAVDPGTPIVDVSTMEEILDRETFQHKVQMILLTGFAGLAMLLASLGIYGVLAYLVSRRTQEIGIRIAIGAAPSAVVRMVLGQALRLSAIGIVAGLVLALGVTRVFSKLLFGVSPTDPATFASVAVLLLAVASAASYLPTRKAMRIDPIAALRDE